MCPSRTVTRTMDMLDRISDLPDCLILEILFPLPEKEAIRTACLSKRWVHLWTLLPNFLFIIKHNQSRRDFFSFVDKTMTYSSQHKLKKFQLHTSYDSSFRSLVNKWLCNACERKVQDVDLSLWHDLNHAERHHLIVLDDSLFFNSSLTNLKLSCDFVNPKTGRLFEWTNLKSLSLSKKSDLDDDSLEVILFGTPCLETFELNDCYGFTSINMRYSSVKKFLISGRKRLVHGYVDLCAPSILSLTVDGALTLCSLYPEDLSSLVEAKFCYHVDDYSYIPFYDQGEEQYALELHILELFDVKDHPVKLKLGMRCLEVLSLLQDEGFVLPSNIILVDDEKFY